MEFTEQELEHIRYALDYLHDADLSDYDDLETLENIMTRLGISFVSQL